MEKKSAWAASGVEQAPPLGVEAVGGLLHGEAIASGRNSCRGASSGRTGRHPDAARHRSHLPPVPGLHQQSHVLRLHRGDGGSAGGDVGLLPCLANCHLHCVAAHLGPPTSTTQTFDYESRSAR